MPLPDALAALHRDLGIPASYGAERGLPLHPEARESELELIAHGDEGRPILLVAAAARAWRQMAAAAAAEGVTLVAVSGFRSVTRQAELIRVRLDRGRTLDAILRYVAAPGFSEHHTGRALDIADRPDSELEESFGSTAAYRWLDRNAPRHGFHLSYPRDNPHGIGYEPWHWCWRAAPDSRWPSTQPDSGRWPSNQP